MTEIPSPQPALAHTHGPWAYDGRVSVKAGQQLVALVYSTGVADELGLTNLGDNARLIAAAPELLDALRELLEAGDDCVNADDGMAAMVRFAEAHKAARDAVAKATGAAA